MNFKHFTHKGIKGPKPIVFFGNFIEEFTTNTTELQEKWARIYGKIYGLILKNLIHYLN